MTSPTGPNTDDGLDNCEAEVAELKAENEYLREAAQEFGELAERLSEALNDERQQQLKNPGEHLRTEERGALSLPPDDPGADSTL